MRYKIIKKIMSSKLNRIISFLYLKFSRHGKEQFLDFIEDAHTYVSFKQYFDKPNYQKLFQDYIYFHHKLGCSKVDYFLYEFYRLSESEIETYITHQRRSELYRYADNKIDWHIFGNKEDFFRVFNEYMSKSCIYVKSRNDKEIFYDFCKDKKEIIVKPVKGERGQGVKKLRVDNDELISIAWKDCMDYEETVQIEAVLCNCKELAAFYAQSLNSVRLSIVLGEDNEPHILAATFRTGSGNNYVDNGHSGGVYAALDVETGMIISCGCNTQGERFYKHPDTGVVFLGNRIPQWEQLIHKAKEIAKIVPTMRYIGWDWILNEEYKWILIEGNEPGAIDIHQQPLKRGLYKEYANLIYKKDFKGLHCDESK